MNKCVLCVVIRSLQTLDGQFELGLFGRQDTLATVVAPRLDVGGFDILSAWHLRSCPRLMWPRLAGFRMQSMNLPQNSVTEKHLFSKCCCCLDNRVLQVACHNVADLNGLQDYSRTKHSSGALGAANVNDDVVKCSVILHTRMKPSP